MDQMFYHVGLTFEDNYRLGPFNMSAPPDFDFEKYRGNFSFLGFRLDVPFGIAAGPLLTSRHVKAAWRWGFALATYKTVRSSFYPCHPFPNVIKVKSRNGRVEPGETTVGVAGMTQFDPAHDGLTNSFGVPSQPAQVWQKDVRQALAAARPGNLLILSFTGTKSGDMTRHEFISDFVKTCRLAKSTGAPVLEVNLSCPNVGREGLVCQDNETVEEILSALEEVSGNTPLLVKIGFFTAAEQDKLESLLTSVSRHAAGVVAINAVQAKVTDRSGKQILPGSPNRLLSGICGVNIRWAGLNMVKRIVEYRQKKNLDMAVLGCGGVICPNDFRAYLKAGAEVVFSVTGAMLHPRLAFEIRREALVTQDFSEKPALNLAVA